MIQSPWQGRILSGFELAPIFRYNSAHPFNLLAGTNVNNDRQSTLQFMVEGFNLFNRTNVGSVNNVVGVIAPPTQPLQGDRTLSPSQPLGFTSALPKRQLQFGVRLSF